MTFLVTIHGEETITFQGIGECQWAASSAMTVSEAKIFIPRRSVAWDDRYIPRDGGYIVEIATAAGRWHGIGDQPVWSPSGAELLVHGPQRWLALREVSTRRTFLGMTAGTIAKRALMDGIVGTAPMVVVPGTFVQAGPVIERLDFHGQKVLDVLRTLVEETGQAWYIDRKMRFHWCERDGAYHEQWVFDDGLLLERLQPLPLEERVYESIEVMPDGRTFSVYREGQPLLWQSQESEMTR